MTLKADLCIRLCIVCTWYFLARARVCQYNTITINGQVMYVFPRARTRLPIFVFLSAFCTFARNALIFNGKSSVDTCALCLHCCLHCNRKI